MTVADESTPAPAPESAAEPSLARSLKVPTIAVMVAGAAVALFAATQIWARGRLAIEGFPGIAVEPTGRTLVPLVPAVGLLALGGALALLLVGRLGRALIGGVVALLALGAALAALRVEDAQNAVAGILAEAAGVTSIPGGVNSIDALPTIWPWVATLGLSVAGIAAVIAATAPASRWPRGGRRYAAATSEAAPAPQATSGVEGPAPDAAGDAPTSPGAGQGRDDGVGLWDALDRGDDPTL